MQEGIKPDIAGPVGIPEPETMATVLVQVKFYRTAGGIPRLDNAELATEEKIITGNHVEHGRSILWYLYFGHWAINGTNKIKFHSFRVERTIHCQSCTCRKADHAQP